MRLWAELHIPGRKPTHSHSSSHCSIATILAALLAPFISSCPLKSPPSFPFLASQAILLWVFNSQQHQKQSQAPLCSGLLMQLQLGHCLATKLLLVLPPPFPTSSLLLCSWQTPRHPHTHGRSWEDCVGGAGHEVRDLS